MSSGGLVIDLFAGPGGWDQGLRAAGHTGPLVGVEHDHDACRTAVTAGHPRVRADVERIPVGHLAGRVDGICASPPCFPAGTTVLTDVGLVPIEKVKVGDRVLTHRGRWCPVTATSSRRSETVTVNGQGHWGLEVTPDHRFWARRTRITGDAPPCGYDLGRMDDEPEWIPAVELTHARWSLPLGGSVVTVPMPQIPDGVMGDHRWFWWMVGRWLDAGSVRLAGSGLASGEHPPRGSCGGVLIRAAHDEVDDLTVRLDKSTSCGWATSRWHATVTFSFRSVELARWLVEHFGAGTSGRTVPAWLLTAPPDVREAVLDGYLSAGTFPQREPGGGHTMVTVSRQLAVGMNLLAVSLGWSTTFARPTRADGGDGRRVLRVSRPGMVTSRWWEDQTHRWCLVGSVTATSDETDVYDIEVADDHSFVADGIVVHNCQLYSQGGKGHGRRVTEILAAAIDDAAAGRATVMARSREMVPVLREAIRETDAVAQRRWLARERDGLTVREVAALRERMADPGPVRRVTGPSRRVDVSAQVWAAVRNVRLVVQPARWVHAARPRWVLLEQVPPVLPLWEATGRALARLGYSWWAGVLNAADYGVPQTRRRAFLIARLDGDASPPAPTHCEGGALTLLGELHPWVTMADALGWGMTGRPYPTIASGRVSGGPDREKVGGSAARRVIYDERDAGRWQQVPPWIANRNDQTGHDETDRDWPTRRPATTIAGRGLVPDPGANNNRFNDAAKSRNDGVRITLQQASVLQTFPADYPWHGSQSSQFRQCGNAVPPLLAAHLAVPLLGVNITDVDLDRTSSLRAAS